MHVANGDRIVVESERIARPPRTGVIERILHRDPGRYSVRWDDGRETIISPAAGAAWIESEEREPAMDGPCLCRSVNERILELERSWGSEHDFICECEDATCTQVMRMNAEEYEAVRVDPEQFAVLPGHERSSSNDVLIRAERYVLVRKAGAKDGALQDAVMSERRGGAVVGLRGGTQSEND